MPDIRLSPSAMRKLESIRRYFVEELGSLATSESTVERILKDITILENNPEVGPRLSSRTDSIPLRFKDTRFLVCHDYIAIYDSNPEGIEVLMIYHSRENVFSRFLIEID